MNDPLEVVARNKYEDEDNLLSFRSAAVSEIIISFPKRHSYVRYFVRRSLFLGLSRYLKSSLFRARACTPCGPHPPDNLITTNLSATKLSATKLTLRVPSK